LKRLLHKSYLFGYKGKTPPKWLRRLVAKTMLHSAWLNGKLGIYTESGRKYHTATGHAEPERAHDETNIDLLVY
jgi:hypothetical protein